MSAWAFIPVSIAFAGWFGFLCWLIMWAEDN
jgi:hypothetical protein